MLDNIFSKVMCYQLHVQLEDAESDDDVKVLFAVDETQALLLESGYSRPLCNLKLSDKEVLKSMLIEYHCLVKVKASIDQFAEGLGDALDLLRKFPSLSKPLFVANNEVLTASELLHIND